jgi:4-hydroxy-3-methylbut-2-enyl diphosphate reductase
MEMRPFLPEESRPLRVLITGGASCPDGLLQQIIAKVNNYFDPSKLRRIEDVITDVENQG